MPRGAPGAQPAENQFTFAKNAFPKRAGSRPGHFVPIDVLNVATTVADEMVMPHAFGVEARGTALDCDLAHQACLHEIAKIVVGGGSRGARVHAIHGLKDFRSRRVALTLHQECHDGIALRRAAQSGVLEGLLDRFDVHETFRLNLM